MWEVVQGDRVSNKDKLSIKRRQKDKPTKRQTFIQSHRYTEIETMTHTNKETKG